MSKETEANIMWVYRFIIMLVVGIASWSIKTDINDFKGEFKELKTAVVNTSQSFAVHVAEDESVKERVNKLEAIVGNSPITNRQKFIQSKSY